MTAIPCRKCLLKDLTSDEYFKNVYEYIQSLDENIKASPEEYEKRLAACRGCNNLMNGMCRLCGCFVEVRAAKRPNRCADSPARW